MHGQSLIVSPLAACVNWCLELPVIVLDWVQNSKIKMNLKFINSSYIKLTLCLVLTTKQIIPEPI